MKPIAARQVPLRLRPFIVTVVVLSFITISEWAAVHRSLDAQSPFSPKAFRYTDLTNFLLRSRQFGRPGMLTRTDLGLPFPYPLPSVFSFLPYCFAGRHAVRAYLVTCACGFLFSMVAFASALWKRWPSKSLQLVMWTTFLLLYPFWFLLDRGNIEVFLWLLVASGLYFFIKHKHVPAAVLFGFAASMKLYPIVFLFLFWKRRTYRAVVAGLAVMGTVTLTTYWIAGPTLLGAMHDAAGGAQILNKYQVAVVSGGVLKWDHSLFGLLKQMSFVYHKKLFQTPEDSMSFGAWVKPYGILVILGCLTLLLFRVRRLPLLNQFGCLTILALLMPFVSYDYTLVHLATVYACLVLYGLENGVLPATLSGARGVFLGILFGIAFSPLTNLAKRLYGGQIKCLVLLGLLAIFLDLPMPSNLFADLCLWHEEGKVTRT